MLRLNSSILLLLLMRLSNTQSLSQILAQDAEQCPHECKCIFKENRRVTDCANLKLTEVPYGIPSNSMLVDLTGNALGNITENNYFYTRHLQDIRHLILDQCRIQALGSGVFNNMELLEKLDLSRNYLSELPRDLFSELSSLRELSLSRNKFEVLHDAVFTGASGLEYIDLSHNLLTRLKARSFAHLPRLRTIDLSNNRLLRLPLDLFNEMPALNLAHLHNNPWAKEDFSLKIRTVKARRLSEPGICSGPQRLKGKTWDQLNDADFACAPEIRQHEIKRKHTIDSGGTLQLYCPVVADPMPIVQWQFHTLQHTAIGDRWGKGNKVLLADTSQKNPILQSYAERLSVRTETVNNNEWRFYLNLTNFTPEDQGHYMCIVSNAADKVMEVFDVEITSTVAAGPTGAPIHSRVYITWDMVLMVIILIGSILIVFLVCLAIVCYRKGDGGSVTVVSTDHMAKATSQGNGIVPSSATTQATKTTRNGYMYHVVTDGTTKLHSSEHNSPIYNQLIDPNLHHANHTPSRIAAQQQGNSLVQRQPVNGLLAANSHLKSVKFKHDNHSSASTSPNSNSLNIAQDDSGYLDSDSPRLLCPLHQSFNDDSPQLRAVHLRAPLARPEAADASVDVELRMPLRETAL